MAKGGGSLQGRHVNLGRRVFVSKELVFVKSTAVCKAYRAVGWRDKTPFLTDVVGFTRFAWRRVGRETCSQEHSPFGTNRGRDFFSPTCKF